MEVTWLGIGFLVGMTLWMPFIVGARMDAKFAHIEALIDARIVRIGRDPSSGGLRSGPRAS